LSLARLGARVTGVDISDEAIEFADRLATDSGIAATFVRADVYDWLEQTGAGGDRFDIAFTSYGVFPWIPDINRLARGVREILTDGGRWVSIEFHPAAMIFDDQWRAHYPYGTGGDPHEWNDGVGDYVADSGETLAPSGYAEGVKEFRNPHRCHEFCWGTAQVVQALIDAGFGIERIVEYPFANGCRQGEGMRRLPGNRYAVPEGLPQIPLMIGWSVIRCD
jgi:SAM-dependent methyltransferase